MQDNVETVTTFETDYELLVIGAGPHALALLGKLMEPQQDELEELPSNSNIFRVSTDNRISARYKVLPDHKFLRKDEAIKQRWNQSFRKQKEHENFLEKVCIIDRNGAWLAQWKYQFEMLNIMHLRSALAAHSDPLDAQGMRVHIEETGNRKHSCIALELDRSDTYHGPFEVPTSKAFNEFSDAIVKRYHLETAVTKGVVSDVRLATKGHEDYFEIKTRGTMDRKCGILTAKNVVFATGPLNIPAFPDFYNSLDDAEKTRLRGKHIYHSCDIMCAHETNSYAQVENFRSLLIIGGGLTAGHLASLAVRHCVAKPHLRMRATMCTRRLLKSRQFDLDLSWMGQERSRRLAAFWSISDYERRLEELSHAKNGGSMTPEILSTLKQAEKSDYFTMKEGVDIEYAYFDEQIAQWEIYFAGGDGPYHYDTVWCATGTKQDIANEGLPFKGLREQMELVGGKMPKLTEELRVREGVNAFVLGEYAGLTLGPGSVNLMGGRAGAARVAEALKRDQVSTGKWTKKNHQG